jgi:predicted Zn-dependent peptidase
MRVCYRRDKDFPLAYATLFFRSGSRQELGPEAGLCSMSIDLLMQGTLQRNAIQLARDMESVGASIGTQAHEDYSEMGFVVPASELDRAFGVMVEVLDEPSFPKEEVIKEKSHVLAGLASRRDTIFNVAYDQLNQALYGDHPYGRPLEGTQETVRTFTRRRLQAWHREKVTPERGILSIVAPYSENDMYERLQKTVGSWRPAKSGAKSLVTIAPVKRLRVSQSRDVTSSFEQAYLMVGWQAPSAGDKDQILLKVLNTLLGGGMSSRLFVTLREKLSLAYEVSSFYPLRLDRSQWVIYLGLPKEKVKTAAQKLSELLGLLADKGPSRDEVRQAKAMLRGAFLMDRQSRRRQAWYTAWWEFLGRGPRYGEEFLRTVDVVTPKQLHRLMQTMMHQPRVTVTVVPKA